MTMKPSAVVFLAALLFGSLAQAQVYQWKDASGKTIFSDKPPPGLSKPTRAPAPSPANEAADESKPAETKPPKTTADRELEFRKRQKENQAATEKQNAEQKQTAERKENCDSTRRYLHALESGERISLRDDKGERFYLDDAQRDQEITKARQAMQGNCP